MKPIQLGRICFDQQEEEAVLEVLRSGWITTGAQTKAFEAEFASYVSATQAWAVTSATAGLYLTYKALGIGSGDDVVVPSITWPATANAVEMCGARAIFCDVDRASVCATRETIAAALTKRTRAVCVVHFAGLACDLDPIVDLCRSHNLLLIEDAAHAAGTRYKGNLIGKPHGDAAVFSFHPIKNMTTAEGGMITVRDSELAVRIERLRFHGIQRDAWERYRDESLPHYDVVEPALKWNLPDVLGAIGRVQLSKLEVINDRRRRIGECYLEELRDVRGIDLPACGPRPEEHSWHLFAIQLNDEARLTREELILGLREHGVMTGLHFLAAHRLSYYRRIAPDCCLPV